MIPSHKHNKHNCRFICNKVKIEKETNEYCNCLIPIHILELKFKINCSIKGNNSKNSMEVWLFVHLVHWSLCNIFFTLFFGVAYCYIAAETLPAIRLVTLLVFSHSMLRGRWDFVFQCTSDACRLYGVLWNGWHLNEKYYKKKIYNIDYHLYIINVVVCVTNRYFMHLYTI